MGRKSFLEQSYLDKLYVGEGGSPANMPNLVSPFVPSTLDDDTAFLSFMLDADWSGLRLNDTLRFNEKPGEHTSTQEVLTALNSYLNSYFVTLSYFGEFDFTGKLSYNYSDITDSINGYLDQYHDNTYLELDPYDEYDIAFGKLETRVANNELVTSAALTNIISYVGLTNDMIYAPKSEFLTGVDNISDALDLLSYGGHLSSDYDADSLITDNNYLLSGGNDYDLAFAKIETRVANHELVTGAALTNIISYVGLTNDMIYNPQSEFLTGVDNISDALDLLSYGGQLGSDYNDIVSSINSYLLNENADTTYLELEPYDKQDRAFAKLETRVAMHEEVTDAVLTNIVESIGLTEEQRHESKSYLLTYTYVNSEASMTDDIMTQQLDGIDEYESSSISSGYIYSGICYSTTEKTLVKKYTKNKSTIYETFEKPVSTKLYYYNRKSYFWNGEDLVAMANDTELQELRSRNGDYTLDFNLYADQLTEVVMFMRKLNRLQLVNIETIKYQINNGASTNLLERQSYLGYLLGEDGNKIIDTSRTEYNEETGEYTEPIYYVTYTGYHPQLSYLTPDNNDSKLAILNNKLNTSQLPLSLTWTITRTTGGKPAAIGALYEDTDTM